MSTKIRVGDRAPDFALPSASGETTRLADFRGKKNVVLFFYPKDETPGCTVEACTFRDNYEAFASAGAEVIGISSDSEESHRSFQSKHRLPMVLLSDRGGEVQKAYGVRSLFGLLPGRVTFLIDREGVVRHVFSSHLRVRDHVAEALDVLRTLGGREGQPALA